MKADGTVKCVILSQPRTGSTLLCGLLSSAPGVRILVEPVNPRTHGHHMKPSSKSNCLLPEELVQNDIVRSLDILFSSDAPPTEWIANRKRGDVLAGFKIMAHQILGLKSEGHFWEYLVSHKVKVILCFRYNILMQYVSDMITIATRQPACWDGKVRTAQVAINTQTLGFELQKIAHQKKYLIDTVSRLGLDNRRIKYEDFKDSITPIEDLLFWLVGQRHALTTKLSKQNPDSLKARVSNYDELVAEVKNLDLEYLLVDTESGE
jgi:LPS sulfotransferase NodH